MLLLSYSTKECFWFNQSNIQWNAKDRSWCWGWRFRNYLKVSEATGKFQDTLAVVFGNFVKVFQSIHLRQENHCLFETVQFCLWAPLHCTCYHFSYQQEQALDLSQWSLSRVLYWYKSRHQSRKSSNEKIVHSTAGARNQFAITTTHNNVNLTSRTLSIPNNSPKGEEYQAASVKRTKHWTSHSSQNYTYWLEHQLFRKEPKL